MIIALQEWIGKILSFNRNIKLFILANVLIQIGMGVFSVMYNLYIKELGMLDTVNGNIISMNALATAVVLIPAGFISDRFGRKKVIIFGLIITAITLFYRSIEVVEQPLIIAAFLTGVFMAFVQVSGVPFLAENSTPSERMHLFSVHFSITTIAGVFGNLFGGLISDGLQIFLSLSAVEAIRWSLLFGATIVTVGLLPMFKLGSESNRNIESEEKKVDKKNVEMESGFKKNLGIIILFAIAQLLIGTGSGLVIPYLNLYFANRFDASNSYIGLIIALGSAMTAVAMLIGPALVKKVGEVKALIFFQLSSIPFLLLTAYTSSLVLASIGFLMRQALMNAGNPISSAIAMDIVHNKYKGLANSVNQTVFQIGWATMGPVATGVVLSHGSYYGYAYTFSITAGLYIISSLYFYIVFGRKKLKKVVK